MSKCKIEGNELTAAGSNEPDVNADEGAEASRRDQVAFTCTFAATNDFPTSGATEQELSSFLLLFLVILQLLLRFARRHFRAKTKFKALTQ